MLPPVLVAQNSANGKILKVLEIKSPKCQKAAFGKAAATSNTRQNIQGNGIIQRRNVKGNFASRPRKPPQKQINGIMRGKDHVLVTCGVDIIGMKISGILAELADNTRILADFNEDIVRSWSKKSVLPKVAAPTATYAQGKGPVWRMNQDGEVFEATEKNPGMGKKVYELGENVQDFGMIEQSNNKFIVLTRCAPKVGFKCRMEFHNVEKKIEQCNCPSKTSQSNSNKRKRRQKSRGNAKTRGSNMKDNRDESEEEACYDKQKRKLRTQPLSCKGRTTADANEPIRITPAQKYPFGTLVCVRVCMWLQALVRIRTYRCMNEYWRLDE